MKPPAPQSTLNNSSNATIAQQRLQMADIAHLAGVSTSTVSRALANSPLVNAKTRARIEELARSLNYSINIGAQNLRLKVNRTVAVVVPFDAQMRQHLSDPFFLGLLGSIADALTEQGYDMLLSRVDAEHLDSVAQAVESGRAIGVILIGQWRHHDQLNQIAARGLPIVVWGAQLPRQIYCTVGSDNEAGGVLATDHLIASGARRIVFLGDANLPEVEKRFYGYRQSLNTAGIAYDADLYRPCTFIADSAREAVLAMCDEQLAFDAIFASSDLLAMAAINALRERGRQTPADIAVVGYDDIELAQYFNPPLTTVRQPIDVAGRELVAALLSLLDGGQAIPRMLPTTLIERATTGRQAD
jgi:DNA-binding LacI/PurR family transcriptional regulator